MRKEILSSQHDIVTGEEDKVKTDKVQWYNKWYFLGAHCNREGRSNHLMGRT